MLERLFGNQAYRDLKAALDVAAWRQVVIAQNIANADTPGYRRKVVEFDEALFAAATERRRLQPARLASPTRAIPYDSRHIPISPGAARAEGEIRVVEDPNAVPNETGNSVDLFQEMADQSINEMRFEALAQLVTMQLLSLRKVINEAGGLG